jgi:hypothetical protein
MMEESETIFAQIIGDRMDAGLLKRVARRRE